MGPNIYEVLQSLDKWVFHILYEKSRVSKGKEYLVMEMGFKLGKGVLGRGNVFLGRGECVK